MASSLSADEIRSMKVVELKSELAKHGLPQTGKKDELIDRLLEFIQSAPSAGAAAVGAVGASPTLEPQQQAQLIQQPQEQHHVITSVVDDEAAQRQARAARFGIPVVVPQKDAKVVEKLAEKSHIDTSLLSEEARLRRIQRFGVVETATSSTPKDAKVGKKQQHHHHHKKQSSGDAGLPSTVEQMRAREARFGVTTSSTLTRIEAKEAMAKRQQRFGGN